MEINGISSTFMNSLTDMKAAGERVDQEKFEKLLRDTMEKKDDDSLKEACGEFESYYLNKVFKEMRQSIPKSGLMEESQGRGIYEDMLYDAYTKEIASGKGVGLKDMLYRQLKK